MKRIIFGIIGIILIITVAMSFYEKGYKAACADFYKGHLKYDLVENEDGTREWQSVVDASHRKRRGCIPCELKAWDDTLKI